MTYQPIQPLELDHMPAEVATEMLANPKTRLTARERKLCAAARENVFWTGTPLHRRTKNGPLEEQEDFEAPSPQQKAARRLQALPLTKLGRLLPRGARLHRRISASLAKAEATLKETTDKRAAARLNKLADAFRFQLARIDWFQSTVREELRRRKV